MLNIKPIPKQLLNDHVMYQEKVTGGRYGDTFKDPINLNYVRVREITSKQRSQLSDEAIHSHTLIFDMVNSTSSEEFNFTVGSKIIDNNTEYVIKKINAAKTFNKIHHYKLELI